MITSLVGQTEIVWATRLGRSLTHRARYMYHNDTCLVLVWMCIVVVVYLWYSSSLVQQ